MVGAEEKAGARRSIGFSKLGGHNQGAIPHLDAAARALKTKTPRGVFHLRGDAFGRRPGDAVIVTVGDYQLPGFLGGEAGARAVPRTVSF